MFLVDETKGVLQAFDAMAVTMRSCLDKVAEQNEHALYQWSDAVLKLHEHGLQLRHDPYQIRVQALSPQGFPVIIQVAKGDAGALVEAVPMLMGWLAQEGYKPVDPVPF